MSELKLKSFSFKKNVCPKCLNNDISQFKVGLPHFLKNIDQQSRELTCLKCGTIFEAIAVEFKREREK